MGHHHPALSSRAPHKQSCGPSMQNLASSEDGNSSPDHLPFKVQRTLDTLFQHSKTPRYLFRVSHSNSCSLTNTLWAVSSATLHGTDAESREFNDPSRDILAMIRAGTDEKLTAARMLGMHLKSDGPSYDTDPKSSLVSWTSSLLYAIQYIIHLSAGDRDKLKDIELYIVDTAKFPKEVFMQDLILIDAFRDCFDKVPELRTICNWREGQFYFGEYLSQGALKIEGKCGMVTADQLVNEHLFLLEPKFGDMYGYYGPTYEHIGLSQTVVELRALAHEAGFDGALQRQRAVAARIIANSLGFCWRLPIAAHLISFHHLETHTNTVPFPATLKYKIPAGLLGGITTAELDELAKGGIARQNTTPERMPEVYQANALLESIINRHLRRHKL